MPRRARMLKRVDGGDGRRRPPREDHDRRSWATSAVTGLALQGRHHAGLRHGGDLRRHPAQRELGLRCGLTVERAHRRRQPHALARRLRRLRRRRMRAAPRRVYGLVAPLWEQAKVLADHITGRNPDAAYHGSKLATKLKVMGVELASMGITEPAEERDEVVQFSEPKRGTLQEADRPRRPAGRRHPARRPRQGRLPDAGVRPQHAAARRAAVAAVRHRRAGARRSRSTRCRTTRRSATATASRKGAIGACVARRRAHRPSW